MCGINGYIDWNGSKNLEDIVKGMNSIQVHRGPDNQDIFQKNNLCLGSVRLSIIDLQNRSNMPMISKDGKHVLIFNGEIYNFKALKLDLEKQGINFSTNSDTEVILQLLVHEGESAIYKLDGMFSIAFYNNTENFLLLARDRIGMKPLYYNSSKNHFAFSSEIKSLLKAVGDDLSLSEIGISDIFSQGYNYGSRTLFKEVKSLLPGHTIKVDLNTEKFETKCFHNVLHSITPSIWKKQLKREPLLVQNELEEDILHSVKQHVYSDAEIGVICSGGVDSSLLATFAHKFRSDIELFHASIMEGVNERPFAEKVAHKLNIPLHVTTINKENYMQHWAHCIYHNDAPSYHPNDIPLFLVCQNAKALGKKVLLSGEGADELFGGYQVNLDQKKRLFWRSILNKIPHRIQSHIKPIIESMITSEFPKTYNSHLNIMGISSLGRVRGMLYSNPLNFGYMERHQKASDIYNILDFLNEKEKQASGYLTERLFSHLITLLMRNDKMGMAASIETRIPFLSNTLIEKWVGMPLKFKINGNNHVNLKYLLKNIAIKYLPSEIIFRPKVGFSIPLDVYMTPNPHFFKGGYLQERFEISDKNLKNLFFDSTTFYKVASIEVWCRLFLLKQSVQEVQENINKQLIRV